MLSYQLAAFTDLGANDVLQYLQGREEYLRATTTHDHEHTEGDRKQASPRETGKLIRGHRESTLLYVCLGKQDASELIQKPRQSGWVVHSHLMRKRYLNLRCTIFFGQRSKLNFGMEFF
jgi:hypothetical protein